MARSLASRIVLSSWRRREASRGSSQGFDDGTTYCKPCEPILLTKATACPRREIALAVPAECRTSALSFKISSDCSEG